MDIQIIGACENNLKDISLRIPRDKLVVVTGVSGSGKSSLVFDTIFAAAEREYLESLGAYARASMPRITPPLVGALTNLSPALAIDQKPLGSNLRSTVGTVTDIYTYLRLLYSRLGEPILSAGAFSFNTPAGACPVCGGRGQEFRVDLHRLLDNDKSLVQGAIRHRAWKPGSRYWNIIKATGRLNMDKPVGAFSSEEMDFLLHSPPLECNNDAIGFVQNFTYEGLIDRLARRGNDTRGQAGKDYDQSFYDDLPCSECGGSRLNAKAREVKIHGVGIAEASAMELPKLRPFLASLDSPVADAIVPAMDRLLAYMERIGVGYLSLDRGIGTLSGGESQRVKIARQLGSPLVQMVYVLDEPTAGLHAADVEKFCEILEALARKPNTVIVVEHDLTVVRRADHVVEIGPGPGTLGGRVVAQGSPAEIVNSDSSTGRALSGKDAIPVPSHRRKGRGEPFTVHGARLNNLKDVTVSIPRGCLTAVTGVSGSGKSSLTQVLCRQYDDFIVVDQSPVGSNSRSNPATYVDVFTDMRKEFADAVDCSPSLLTFNGEGACPACEGLGYISVDMHFVGDVRFRCEECQGRRFQPLALKYRYKGKNISEVLLMTVSEALPFFESPEVIRGLGLLKEVGLGYLEIGQSLSTLSGGERQRLKLATHLKKRGHAYLLDEPTRGLHHADVQTLLGILHRLVDRGDTIVVVEHQADVIMNADWVIDIGPGGGRDGGQIVAEGTPEDVMRTPHSLTGRYLAREYG